MPAYILIFLLWVSAVCGYPVVINGIDTVDQGLAELREAFPDWEENYIEHEFDCSEMSAFVYEYLKCCGLEPELKTGVNEEGTYAHAWVECQGKIIEATWLHVNLDKSFYNSLEEYEMSASKAKNEIDWWNSQYIKGLQDDELMSWGQ